MLKITNILINRECKYFSEIESWTYANLNFSFIFSQLFLCEYSNVIIAFDTIDTCRY